MKPFDKELKTHVLMMFKEVNEDKLSIKKKKENMKQKINNKTRKRWIWKKNK